VGRQLVVEACGAAPDLQPARQHAGGVDAALDALLHHRPDVQQPVADLGLAAPGQLVGQHHVADPQPGGTGVDQQVGSAAERVRDRGLVLDDDRVTGLVLVEDEASSDGVVVAAIQLAAVDGEREETHAVAVDLQTPAAVQDDVVVNRELDRVQPGQGQLAVSGDRIHPGLRGHRVDHVGLFTLQAQDDGLYTAVAVTGGPERAEQFTSHPGHVVQHAAAMQPVGERNGGTHGADRVRAGRADPNLEHVENADCHPVVSLALGVCVWVRRLGRRRTRLQRPAASRPGSRRRRTGPKPRSRSRRRTGPAARSRPGRVLSVRCYRVRTPRGSGQPQYDPLSGDVRGCTAGCHSRGADTRLQGLGRVRGGGE
jgi:hypothetical protein